MNANADRNDQIPVRHQFVGMLFALVIGYAVGILAKLEWTTFEISAAAYAHLVLTIMMVTMSWVGWSNYTKHIDPVKGIFSGPFVVLLIDVFIVICYFIIASGIEFDVETEEYFAPSAKNETSWISVVFVAYLLWDLVAYLLWDLFTVKKLYELIPTVICLAFAVIACCKLGQTAGTWSVFLTDVVLLLVLLHFRHMKERVFNARLNWFSDSGLTQADVNLLNSGTIPDIVKQLFKINDAELSESAQISTLAPGIEWKIADRGKSFIAKKKDTTINIYGGFRTKDKCYQCRHAVGVALLLIAIFGVGTWALWVRV